jgi:hypothetical protein
VILESGVKCTVHCTKPKFSPENIPEAFFAIRKDVEFYSQMPGKRILAFEFSNFSGYKLPGGNVNAFRCITMGYPRGVIYSATT